MTDPAPTPGDQFVQSLARGLSVITAFDADHPSMTLSEIAGRTGLTRATARRFLHTLVELGYVRFDGKWFSLTPQVLRLGTAYLSGLGLPQIAQPHLEQLSARLGESTSAAVLDGDEIVYVARVATRRIMTVSISVGTRFPAYAASMGRVLLAGLDDAALDAYLARVELVPLTNRTVRTTDALRAELDKVRQQGWALVDQELEIGLRSLAAPIRDARGKVVAAVNISTNASAVASEPVPDTYRDALAATAAAISADLVATALD
jgi:IclR family pca regulon transcriptional regulator